MGRDADRIDAVLVAAECNFSLLLWSAYLPRLGSELINLCASTIRY